MVRDRETREAFDVAIRAVEPVATGDDPAVVGYEECRTGQRRGETGGSAPPASFGQGPEAVVRIDLRETRIGEERTETGDRSRGTHRDDLPSRSWRRTDPTGGLVGLHRLEVGVRAGVEVEFERPRPRVLLDEVITRLDGTLDPDVVGLVDPALVGVLVGVGVEQPAGDDHVGDVYRGRLALGGRTGRPAGGVVRALERVVAAVGVGPKNNAVPPISRRSSGTASTQRRPPQA